MVLPQLIFGLIKKDMRISHLVVLSAAHLPILAEFKSSISTN